MFRFTNLFEMLSFYYSVLVVLLVVVCASSAEDGNDGNSKMTKFPQAGLSDPELINWGENGVYNSFEDYEEYPPMEAKHQIPGQYQRVGRGGNGNYLNKVAVMKGIHRGIRAGNSMWFGPRLGRVQKRGENNRA